MKIHPLHPAREYQGRCQAVIDEGERDAFANVHADARLVKLDGPGRWHLFKRQATPEEIPGTFLAVRVAHRAQLERDRRAQVVEQPRQHGVGFPDVDRLAGKQ